jgi:uncharacterized repeat protein (TIGR03803 family)
VRRAALAALLLAMAAVTAPGALAQTYEVVHQFRADAGAPVSPPIDGGDGSLYGVVPAGGIIGEGYVFRLTPDGVGGFIRTQLHEFSAAYAQTPFTSSTADGAFPIEPLTPMSDGYLYGVTFQGGTAYCGYWGGCGTVFRIDRKGGLTTIHNFDIADGIFPNGPLFPLPDGKLAGVAQAGPGQYGVLYEISRDGGYQIVHSFASSDGSEPHGTLAITADGSIYGISRLGGANGAGVLFRIDPGGGFHQLHDFDAQLGAPVGGLVRASDGMFYGLYSVGGVYGRGGIFRSDPSGGVTLVHAFTVHEGTNAVAALALGADGRLYGTTQEGGASNLGTLFRVSTSGAFEMLASFDGTSGAHPQHALVLLPDGSLLGAAPEGGLDGIGAIFRVDTSGALTSAYAFRREEGSGSAAHLVQMEDGSFVGTTEGGGHDDKGVVFRVESDGAFEIVHHFTNADGATPRSGLLLASDGTLYGTTVEGGESGLGTIYSIDPSGSFASLFSFSGGNGLHPVARLAEANDGRFYGVTQGGGVTGAGTVFRFDPPSSVTTLHTFPRTEEEGSAPVAPLVQASDGYLYGAAEYGGSSAGYGTLFRLDTLGGFTKIHDFNSDDGAWPRDGMIQASDGMLYGTTYGGAGGTLYRVDPAGGFANLHSFGNGSGSYPMAAPVEATDGNLYGTTYYGGLTDRGTLYGISKSGENYQTLRQFSPWDLGGAFPSSRMIQASDGDFYGTAGPVYRYSLQTYAPEITGLSPSSGLAAGGTALTVLGRHFRQEAFVKIGRHETISATALDSRTIATIATVPLQAGSLWDVIATFPDGTQAILENAWMSDFNDVDSPNPFHDSIEAILRAGITSGCGDGNYCPTSPVRRDQMAVFLVSAEHGAGYTPPPCTGVFNDVPCPSDFANWIEQLAAEGVTGGCGAAAYCPTLSVTRAQMAVFLLKTTEGSSYTPPPATGIFGDVPVGSFAADFIEELHSRGITGGCSVSPLLYCPDRPVLRQQMATFLARTFLP